MDLNRELGRLLGFKFWEVSPLSADSEDPPGYMLHNPLQSGILAQSLGAQMRVGSEANQEGA